MDGSHLFSAQCFDLGFDFDFGYYRVNFPGGFEVCVGCPHFS